MCEACHLTCAVTPASATSASRVTSKVVTLLLGHVTSITRLPESKQSVLC